MWAIDISYRPFFVILDEISLKIGLQCALFNPVVRFIEEKD